MVRKNMTLFNSQASGVDVQSYCSGRSPWGCQQRIVSVCTYFCIRSNFSSLKTWILLVHAGFLLCFQNPLYSNVDCMISIVCMWSLCMCMHTGGPRLISLTCEDHAQSCLTFGFKEAALALCRQLSLLHNTAQCKLSTLIKSKPCFLQCRSTAYFLLRWDWAVLQMCIFMSTPPNPLHRFALVYVHTSCCCFDRCWWWWNWWQGSYI